MIINIYPVTSMMTGYTKVLVWPTSVLMLYAFVIVVTEQTSLKLGNFV